MSSLAVQTDPTVETAAPELPTWRWTRPIQRGLTEAVRRHIPRPIAAETIRAAIWTLLLGGAVEILLGGTTMPWVVPAAAIATGIAWTFLHLLAVIQMNNTRRAAQIVEEAIPAGVILHRMVIRVSVTLEVLSRRIVYKAVLLWAAWTWVVGPAIEAALADKTL